MYADLEATVGEGPVLPAWHWHIGYGPRGVVPYAVLTNDLELAMADTLVADMPVWESGPPDFRSRRKAIPGILIDSLARIARNRTKKSARLITICSSDGCH